MRTSGFDGSAEHSEKLPGLERAYSAPSSTDQLAFLDVQFTQQSTDRAWASDSASQLEGGLGQLVKGRHAVQPIECRSSLCRARVTETAENCDEFIKGVVHQEPPYFWKGPYMVRRADPSKGEACAVTMYFGREGQPLPALQ